MSSTIASSILRKFSACRSSLDENGIAPSLVTPFDDVGDVGAEQLRDPLDRGLGVLDDVVQQPGGDGHDVELHVGEQVGDFERVDQVGLARMADLSLVLEGREDVRPPQQLDVGVGIVCPDLFDEVLEPDHDWRCLTSEAGRSGRVAGAALTWCFSVHYTDSARVPAICRSRRSRTGRSALDPF